MSMHLQYVPTKERTANEKPPLLPAPVLPAQKTRVQVKREKSY
jgi:hypothetical protein